MGYHLSSLATLPIQDDIDLYFFVVGEGLASAEGDELQRNFLNIARQIGKNAVIAQGLDENLWSKELMTKYFGVGAMDFFHLLPAILVTDAHPDDLTADSLRIVVPLRAAKQKYGDLPSFFRAMIMFARRENPDFIKAISENRNTLADVVGKANEILLLEPNVAGVGVNLNAAVKRWVQQASKNDGIGVRPK
jgi:hypothetical protein